MTPVKLGSRASVAIALFLGAGVACGSREEAEGAAALRSCRVVVWHKPQSADARVELVGDFNGWRRPGLPLEAAEGGYRAAALDLTPGEQRYVVVEDGTWLPDRNVGTTAYEGGREVTWIDVPSCDVPAWRIDGAVGSSDAATITATFLAARDRSTLDPGTVRARAGDGRAATVRAVDTRAGKVTLEARGLARGRYTFVLEGRDARGRSAEAAPATVWIEPAPFDARDHAIYQVLVDRLANERGPVAAPSSAGGRAGGNLAGVRAMIARGDLEAMGLNTLWLSPLYENPDGAFPGTDGRQYTSYHGYWPRAPRAIDPRVGTEDDVKALVREAHARGIRVLFDVVPNHVHEQHPYAKRPGWTDGSASCVCGVGRCDWATHIQDCWFAPYLPDVDWTHPDLARTVAEDVRWWIDALDADGVRIDAVPMMPRSATRRIAHAIRRRHDHPGHRTFLLGEDFTGPGGYGLLRYHLGPDGLDGQFHFPLMWAVRRAIAEGTSPLSDVDVAVRTGEAEWAGSGAVMGLIIGNHDVPRFASVSAGVASGDGWTPAPASADPAVFARQRLALGVVFALPGAPVVYYGDEIALPGRGDPDSRRVMPREEDLSPAQREVREFTRRLGRLRACSIALRRGTYRALFASEELVAFARESAADPANGRAAERAVVVLTRSPAGVPSAPLPGIPAGSYVDAMSGQKASLTPELTKLDPGAFSVRVYLPEGHRCANP